MLIFISHASENAQLADEINLALVEGGYKVFYDRDSLHDAEEYITRIREAVDKCNLLVFLISSHSIANGRYTLTELEYARHRWPHPKGRVIPVVIEPVDHAAIPPYLRAVTFLEPQGNIPAEVLLCIKELDRPKRLLRMIAMGLALILMIGLSAWLYTKFSDSGTSESQKPDVIVRPTKGDSSITLTTPIQTYIANGIVKDSLNDKVISNARLEVIGFSLDNPVSVATSSAGDYSLTQQLPKNATTSPVVLSIVAKGYTKKKITVPFERFTGSSPYQILLTKLPEPLKKDYVVPIRINYLGSNQPKPDALLTVNGSAISTLTFTVKHGSYDLSLPLTEVDAQKPVKITCTVKGYSGGPLTIKPYKYTAGGIVTIAMNRKEVPPEPGGDSVTTRCKVVLWVNDNAAESTVDALLKDLERLHFPVTLVRSGLLTEQSEAVIYYSGRDRKDAKEISALVNLGDPVKQDDPSKEGIKLIKFYK